jgi:regulator of protease activity HflC (stomatin/prohibitin superfamily)
VNETSHARSRGISIFGLIVQALCAAGVAALALSTRSLALIELAWLLSGGILIWFICLLVFRQHELAEVEALDLDELRREKQATGGGEALFGGEGGVSSGMAVAATRLRWMQQWLVPAFALLTGAYLLGIGLWRWGVVHRQMFVAPAEEALGNVQISLIVLAIVLLGLFFLSRYAAGMGRVGGWQLLRACGSYMLACSIVAMAITISFGVYLYQGSVTWERVIAYATPLLMVVLGGETLLNFLLDRYRPRTPGTEPRAAFDSRLLGLIAEPGGIAHSLAEAVNYQFGFRVSQTWFYQLLQRTLVPLIGLGGLMLWLLTCIVVVWPNERAIIERFGRQVDTAGLGPGLHFKWPAPFELARKFDTGEYQQFFVGYKSGDQPDPDYKKTSSSERVELWTDERHAGREHFDLLIAIPQHREPAPASGPSPATQPAVFGPLGIIDERAQRAAPVHLVRVEVYVQYRISPDRLGEYTRSAAEPDRLLRVVAWNEVTKFVASATIDDLMGELLARGGEQLRGRINQRLDTLDLGIDVIEVGFPKVHPERNVSESFRRVVTAQMEKTAEIRRAIVTENQLLSEAAGDRPKALQLAHAIRNVSLFEHDLSNAEAGLRSTQAVTDSEESALQAIEPQFRAVTEARWDLQRRRDLLDEISRDWDLGLGRTLQQRGQAETAVHEAQVRLEQASSALNTALEPVRRQLSASRQADEVERLIAHRQARAAAAFWNGQLEASLVGLEGQAAVVLANAQAARWERELRAAGEVARVLNERSAYAVAPEIYKARRYLQVVQEGIRGARKYLLGFDPASLHLRLEAQETARPDLTEMQTRISPGQ